MCEDNTLIETVNYGSGIQCQRKYKNGILRLETWLKDGVKNRNNDEPAEIEFYENGIKYRESWYHDGYLYRENDLPNTIWYSPESKVIYESWESDSPRENDKPSEVGYYENGVKEYESWLIDHVGFHRENDQPAVIEYYNSFDENRVQRVKSQSWYIDDIQQRDNGFPSEIEYDEEGNEVEN